MKILKNKRGFSLVELMVVVAIMGILSAIAIPSYLSYQDNARIGVAESMLHLVDRAIANELARGQDLKDDITAANLWLRIESNDKDEFKAPVIVLSTGATTAGNWCIYIDALTTGKYKGLYGCVSNSSDAAIGKQIKVLKAATIPDATDAVAGRCTIAAGAATSAVCAE